MTATVADRPGSPLEVHLEAVRRALLDDAQRAAEALTAKVDAEAEQIGAEAAAQRDRALETARAEGAAAAEQEAARRTATAKRAIRARILAAQRRTYDDLRTAVRDSVLELREDPVYSTLLDRWSAIARAQLGEGAEITRDPADDGGVIAIRGDRRVAYTLTALGEHELDRLSATVGALWT